ncbi:MAG: hypothetical protein QOG47_1286 [Mycobacterium sp.]|nr:hypothetical protein [Mycobacterium sp.]
MSPRSRLGAAVAWVVGPLTYLTLEGIAAASFPHYSYAQNFISDLGMSVSPRASLMNIAFCVQGTLFLVGALLCVRAVEIPRARLFLVLAATNMAGNLLIAVFHSGPSGMAWLHATGAVLAIVGGNVAILAGSSLIGGWHRTASVALGAFGLFSFACFVIALKNQTPPAVWERCSVYSITAWELLTAARVLSRRPNLSRARARRA